MSHVVYHKIVEKIRLATLLVASNTGAKSDNIQSLMGEYIDHLQGTKIKDKEIDMLKQQLDKEVAKGPMTITHLEEIDKEILPAYKKAVAEKLQEIKRKKESIEETLDILDLMNY